MKRIFIKLFPIFSKDYTPSKKTIAKKIFESFVNFWLILWIFYSLFRAVSPIYKYSYASNPPIKSNEHTAALDKEIDAALNGLKKHGIQISETIYMEFCKSDAWYYLKLFPGFQTMALGTSSYTLYDTITLRKIDLEKGIYFLDEEGKHRNNLRHLLIHEMVHVWQYRRYGMLYAYALMPTWIKEGYAVYVASQKKSLEAMLYPAINVQNKTEFIADYLEHNSELFKKTPFDYLMYGMMVQHAIEDMNKSVDDLHLGKVDYDEVLDSLLRKYGLKEKP